MVPQSKAVPFLPSQIGASASGSALGSGTFLKYGKGQGRGPGNFSLQRRTSAISKNQNGQRLVVLRKQFVMAHVKKDAVYVAGIYT